MTIYVEPKPPAPPQGSITARFFAENEFDKGKGTLKAFFIEDEYEPITSKLFAVISKYPYTVETTIGSAELIESGIEIDQEETLIYVYERLQRLQFAPTEITESKYYTKPNIPPEFDGTRVIFPQDVAGAVAIEYTTYGDKWRASLQEGIIVIIIKNEINDIVVLTYNLDDEREQESGRESLDAFFLSLPPDAGYPDYYRPFLIISDSPYTVRENVGITRKEATGVLTLISEDLSFLDESKKKLKYNALSVKRKSASVSPNIPFTVSGDTVTFAEDVIGTVHVEYQVSGDRWRNTKKYGDIIIYITNEQGAKKSLSYSLEPEEEPIEGGGEDIVHYAVAVFYVVSYHDGSAIEGVILKKDGFIVGSTNSNGTVVGGRVVIGNSYEFEFSHDDYITVTRTITVNQEDLQ